MSLWLLMTKRGPVEQERERERVPWVKLRELVDEMWNGRRRLKARIVFPVYRLIR